jgi:transcriptional regulator with XRE-family HTH domain
MSVNNLHYKIPNCQETIYNNSMPSFDAGRFAEWLEAEFRKSSFKSYSELADRAGLKRSTVSSLVTAKPQSATGKASQPKVNTVTRLATALDVDLDQALLMAGHAPQNPVSPKPKNLGEFLGALEALGIEQFQFATRPGALDDYTEDDFEELLERIKADVDITLKRKRR